MRTLTREEASALFEKRLNRKGVFLTVSDGKKVNTMTIGWGMAGVMWRKGVVAVPVRNTRYTYELLQKAKSFTVSIPDESDESEELLKICGTMSGRDSDKMSKLKLEKAKSVDGYVVADRAVAHIECSICQHSNINNGTLCTEIDKNNYAKGDYHIIYIGQIEAAYGI